jgi:hypothetical protein
MRFIVTAIDSQHSGGHAWQQQSCKSLSNHKALAQAGACLLVPCNFMLPTYNVVSWACLVAAAAALATCAQYSTPCPLGLSLQCTTMTTSSRSLVMGESTQQLCVSLCHNHSLPSLHCTERDSVLTHPLLQPITHVISVVCCRCSVQP